MQWRSFGGLRAQRCEREHDGNGKGRSEISGLSIENHHPSPSAVNLKARRSRSRSRIDREIAIAKPARWAAKGYVSEIIVRWKFKIFFAQVPYRRDRKFYVFPE
ncbi:hypothetical protein [Tardiphaga sp. OK246]|uniref:hypothetical protein n=1 Tax=Tardiphaga sp. OK246 TaxID=1855307 RepID=UPI00113077CA|nr:hypothetical protein [Tardiphaga sp. OK246]